MSDKAKSIATIKAGILEAKLALDRKDYEIARESIRIVADVICDLEDQERLEDEDDQT